MLTRVVFTLREFWCYRYQLSNIAKDKNKQVKSVSAVSPAQLAGVKCIVLDFDGVLAPHGSFAMPDGINTWLKSAVKKYGENRVFVLTNKYSIARQEYFAKNFPAIQLIGGVRKKPYPDGLNKIMQLAGCKSNEVLLFDDRLATGCLAACIAGVKILYVTKPLINLRNNFFVETCFIILRYLERLPLIIK